MNILFAVQNNNGWDSKTDSRFGRGNGYMLYSEESKQLSYHSNKENVNTGHGAGIQAGQLVVNLGTNIVITGGSIGPKAFNVLSKAKIKVYTQVGEISVKEAYESFRNGKYKETLKSDK